VAASNGVINLGVLGEYACKKSLRMQTWAENYPVYPPRIRQWTIDCPRCWTRSHSVASLQRYPDNRIPWARGQGMLVILAPHACANGFADKGQKFLRTYL